MKLIIQIPCFNEEDNLAATIKDLPREIPGIDVIEIQIVDDGSTDRTGAVAAALEVDHIISLKKHQGLAAAFRAGVHNAIIAGADILVNTDADNQYVGADIVRLVEPLLKHEADIVVGCRPIDAHPDFSKLKKIMQKLGTWVLQRISDSEVRDAPSGFRAYSREALLHLNIFSTFSYTMETLIQASHKGLKIKSADISVNPKRRESRLFRNIFHYIYRSIETIFSVLMIYRSGGIFKAASLLVLFLGILFSVRYLSIISEDPALSNMFWPTIILAGALLNLSVLLYLVGFLSKMIATNRNLAEEMLFRLRRMDIERERSSAKLEPLSARAENIEPDH